MSSRPFRFLLPSRLHLRPYTSTVDAHDRTGRAGDRPSKGARNHGLASTRRSALQHGCAAWLCPTKRSRACLVDGRGISVPLAWSWRLSEATPAQRAHWTLIGNGDGVHWPEIDEGLRADGLLNGVPARRPRCDQPPRDPAVRRGTAPLRARVSRAPSPGSRCRLLKTHLHTKASRR